MIAAHQALSSMEKAIRDIRRDEDQLAAAMRSSTDEVAQLRLQQAESFKSLAQIRLDSIQQGEIAGRIGSTERMASEILDRRRQALDKLARELGQVRRKKESLETARLKKIEAVERALKAVDDLEARVEKELESNATWTAQNEKREKAAAVARAADEKATAAEDDLEKKGEPYKNDRLFMYLWKAGFGTAQYDAGSLTRFFDRKIAHLIGFETARQDFRMLNEIPLRLREHADFVGQEAREEEDKLEQIERRELETQGIVALEKQLEQAHGSVAEAEGQLAKLGEELIRLEEEQQALVDPAKDPEYQKAVEMVADALGREDLRALWQEARQTPSPEDEGIVRHLQELDEAIDRAESRIVETRKSARELASRRAELESSRDRFYRSGYDDPLGGFSNGDLIAEVIRGIVAGALQGHKLDRVFEEGFNRGRSSRRGDLGGGIRFPSGGPVTGPWTGGRSSGGRKSGGGFRTGGSF